MSGTSAITMGDRGRLVIPAALRHRVGWEQGVVLHLIETEAGVVLMTRSQLLDVRAQWRMGGSGTLEELIEERRAAAARERLETP